MCQYYWFHCVVILIWWLAEAEAEEAVVSEEAVASREVDQDGVEEVVDLVAILGHMVEDSTAEVMVVSPGGVPQAQMDLDLVCYVYY